MGTLQPQIPRSPWRLAGFGDQPKRLKPIEIWPVSLTSPQGLRVGVICKRRDGVLPAHTQRQVLPGSAAGGGASDGRVNE